MARNGSGTFNRLYDWTDERDAGNNIDSTKMDAEMDGMATALTDSIAKDGQTPATANLPMGGFRHTGVSAGVGRTDYSRLDQTQDGLLNWADGGGTADAITATYTPSISSLSDGQMCFVRATAANTSTTPTFSPNGLTARTIVKQGGEALVAGDIAGDGHELMLRYDSSNTRWELLNPDPNITVSAFGATLIDDADAGTARATLDAMEDVFTTRGDLVYRGASAEARLAKGTEGQALIQGADDPAWSNPTTIISNVDMTNGGANDQTSVVTNSLPSWMRWATLVIEGYSQDANDDVGIQIGPSGGLATTGYIAGRTTDAATRTTSTTQVIVNNGTSTVSYTTQAHLVLIDASNNTWSCFGWSFSHSNAAMSFFGGYVSLSGALEQIAVKSVAGSNNFDAGVYNLAYGG